METRDHRDAQTRAVLLAAARELVAEDADFSLKTLLTRTGVAPARFRRSFADKAQLVAALGWQDVSTLDRVLEAVRPSQESQVEIGSQQRGHLEQRAQLAQAGQLEHAFGLRAAMGGDFAPAAADSTERAAANPATAEPVVNDAWLERRLRVFERALGVLEKRQEKSEQDVALRLAVIGERLDLFMHDLAPNQAAPAPPAEAARPSLLEIAAGDDDWNGQIEKADPESGDAEPETGEAEMLELVHPEPDLFAGVAETETAEKSAAGEDAAPAHPAENNFDEKEINDFVAHARKLALDASAKAEAAPPRRLINPRGLAWSGAVLLTLIVCAGMLYAKGALLRPLPVVAKSGVSHRQMATSALQRVIALADSGNANAETVLALDYLRGDGVASDDAAARRWSKAAAEQGQPMGQYVLGTLYQQDESAAGEAVRWFRAAAEQGNLKAMHNLAIAYAEGQGVDRDPAEAVTWFERAAEQGYRDSEFDLAVLYERGEGVTQSARTALKWYLIAAGHGDAPAAERADILKRQVDPLEVELATADAAQFELKPMRQSANQVPTP